MVTLSYDDMLLLKREIDRTVDLVLGEINDREKERKPGTPQKHAKYIWMVDNEISHTDIRRYAFSHAQAISQVSKPRKDWHLYKLVRVNKRRAVKGDQHGK